MLGSSDACRSSTRVQVLVNHQKRCVSAADALGKPDADVQRLLAKVLSEQDMPWHYCCDGRGVLVACCSGVQWRNDGSPYCRDAERRAERQCSFSGEEWHNRGCSHCTNAEQQAVRQKQGQNKIGQRPIARKQGQNKITCDGRRSVRFELP